MLQGCLIVGRTVDAQALCAVQVWNMQTGQQHDLPGHQAEVLALATTAGMLFSGGKDGSIRAWQFDAASSTFRPTVRTHPFLVHEQIELPLLFPGGRSRSSLLSSCAEWEQSAGETLLSSGAPALLWAHLTPMHDDLLTNATCLLGL